MNNTVEKMVERIENEIKVSKRYFEATNEVDTLTNSKICGMIEMLQMVTGKEYYFDENGLHER